MTLYTCRSGIIGTAEQAALLLSAGLAAQQVILTSVTAHATAHAARARGVEPDVVPVGFKHVAAARQGHRVLGVEPNGALAWAESGRDWFDRDALIALTLVLETFGSLDDLDTAVAEHRTRYPFPQQILSTPVTEDKVSGGLSTTSAASIRPS
ncbi:hypothetical protein [Nocardia sp. NPDC046763]|uniref:hypothetical protein n=1 Tax=Nocardia sp. NPDC046763 TaxID=3155256 RepID=UPI0033DCE8C4